MDYIGATPQQNPIMGLLAERLKQAQQFAAKPFGYQNPPAEMLLNLLGIPAVQQTAERLAYGEPLTTGRGMTTRPRPEAVEAALTVAPVAGLLGKATKGLPVGASIKSLDDFAEIASKGKVNMAKSQKQELDDLLSGKSKFAEVNLNWDMPETYDLADSLAEKGFKSKIDDRGVTRFYKNEKDIQAIESAQTPIDFGKAYGYSDEDIAAFYLQRRGGDKEAAYKDFLSDKPVGGLLGTAEPKAAQSLLDIQNKFPDVGLDVYENKGTINLSKIVVPKEMRSSGMGSSVMNDLVDYADSTGQKIALTPSSDFGGNVKRLKEFYKSFGFVENKGKNKDFSTRETMIRPPNIIEEEKTRFNLLD